MPCCGLQARQDKLKTILQARSAGNARDLATASTAGKVLSQVHKGQPAERLPEANPLSPAEDRSWLSSALDKPEQLQRWSAKTPCPAASANPAASSSPEDDPIQSAEPARPSSQQLHACPSHPDTEQARAAKRGAGWHTAVHRLGLAPHGGHARHRKDEADLISPWHFSTNQSAKAAHASSKPHVQPSAQPRQLNSSPKAPSLPGAQPSMHLEGLIEPVSEPSMRKKRSGVAVSEYAAANQNQPCNIQPADPIICSRQTPGGHRSVHRPLRTTQVSNCFR